MAIASSATCPQTMHIMPTVMPTDMHAAPGRTRRAGQPPAGLVGLHNERAALTR